jgi:O-succinylbenzoic acid--CoA ligase
VIPWDAPSTEILLNPRLPEAETARIRSLIGQVPPLDGHVWLTTSGSTERLKPVALSKRALLASAAAVNRHLQSDASDVWLSVLPTFHVGGLGIHARGHLSGARVVTLERWSAEEFAGALAGHAVTLTALVPTHVFDLVRGEHHAPPSLRAVVVGGGRLDEHLYRAARALGWPVLPSYGATECASQIATAELSSVRGDAFPPLMLLTHAWARTDPDGRLAIRSDALFTGYAAEAGLDDPKRDGWWRTDDEGTVSGRVITVHGRADDTVKVGGELVNLGVLESRLSEIAAAATPGTDAALLAVTDERLGHVIALAVATTDPDRAARLLNAFNAGVLPFERARSVQRVDAIPRTPLGKVRRGELSRRISQR